MSYRVMIIDDEKIAADMTRVSLEDEGYEVETFADGASALARLKETPFDVVITDLKMKGLDGFDVLNKIRETGSGAKVIMVTAFANLDIAIEAIKGDAFDFFTKPVKLKELKASVRKAVQGEG
ncbi:MAG: response regulator [Thermoleophilia bacterium]|jgi:DNA-binding NtrC family response regulator|nr:response regulator [Actinomycetota bacterium]MDA8166401.1 response regulator [Actinomycetota bacterium]